MCCRILAEMGAEVIKVEPPEGDMWRKFMSEIQPGSYRDSACFSPANINKNSVVIDYRKAEGMKEIHKLLKECDILITNVRLDSLRRAGL
jgi:CoA:oxalate CoA-transferase